MSGRAQSSASEISPSFYLIPSNSAARSILHLDHNAPYIADKNGENVLYINFIDRNTGFPQARVTLGRDPRLCDIVFPDNNAGIQREHCFFEYNQTTGAVILFDLSANKGTVVDDFEDDCIVPISQKYESVVIGRGFNRNLHFGRRNYYKFQVIWDGKDLLKSFLSMPPNHFGPQRSGFDASKARYVEGELLGSGAFGFVRRAVNIRNGTPMAVKRFHSLEGKGHVMAVREINNMLKVSSNNRKKHEHILHVLDVEYDKDNYKWIEIFMPLLEGSVKLLVESGISPLSSDEIGNLVLYQMAEALKYMAKHDIVHRDVKPDNILYQTLYDDSGNIYSYHFCLADFGLSSESAVACTRAGTPIFMAPEVYHRRSQSPKTDIWSLFVTICWIYDWDDFRTYVADDPEELLDIIRTMADRDEAVNIKDMAEVNPQHRVSARSLVARLKDVGMQSMDDMAQNMASMSIGSAEEPYVPAVTGEVSNRFQEANGGTARRRRQATMNGQSAILQFANEAEPSYVEQSYHTATQGQAYGRPRRVRESQDYEEAGGFNGVEEEGEEEEEAGDDGGYASTYHYHV